MRYWFLDRAVLVVRKDGSQVCGLLDAVDTSAVRVVFERNPRRQRGLRIKVEDIRVMYPYMASDAEVYRA